MTYTSEVLADSPSVWLRLNESSGTTAADSSGNGRSFTAPTAPAWGAASLVPSTPDAAVSISSGAQALSRGPESWMFSADYTIEGWIKTTSDNVLVASIDDVSQGFGNSRRRFLFGLGGASFGNTPGALMLWVYYAPANHGEIFGGPALNDGLPHHVVAVVDTTLTQTIKLYVDGVMVASTSTAGITLTGSLSDRPFAIGTGYNGSNTTYFAPFNGELDEVAFYSSALPESRVVAHYTAGTSTVLNASVGAALPSLDAMAAVSVPQAITVKTGADLPSLDTSTAVLVPILARGSADLPGLGVTSSALVLNPVSATAAADLPGLEVAASIAVTEPLTIVADASLPSLDASSQVAVTGAPMPAVPVWADAGLPSLDVGSAVQVPLPLGALLNPLQVVSPAAISFAGAEDTADPPAQAGPAGASDVWVRIPSSITATLVLTWAGPAVGLEVWDAPPDGVATDVDALGFQAASTTGSLTADVGESSAVYARVYPLSTADNTGSGTLTWTLTARETSQISLVAFGDVYDPPSRLTVDVMSATAGQGLEFELDGVALSQATADESGLLLKWGLLIDATPGTHTLLVRDVTTSQVDQVTFTVVQQTGSGQTVTPTPSTPGIGASPDPVVRWIVLGIAPGATPYVFPNNPSQMDSPHPKRQITSEFTTHPGGQPILFEGEPVPAAWTIEGTAFNQAHYEALDGFQAANERYWVIDHLQRAWLCTFERIDWSELKDRSHPWAHRYRILLNIYEGPVVLT